MFNFVWCRMVGFFIQELEGVWSLSIVTYLEAEAHPSGAAAIPKPKYKKNKDFIFIFVINQLVVQHFCFTISLFHACTGFEYMCSKHVEAWNKLIVKQKFCASSWLITEKNILRCTVSKTSKKIVDAVLSKFLRDIPFSRNKSLKSADH